MPNRTVSDDVCEMVRQREKLKNDLKAYRAACMESIRELDGRITKAAFENGGQQLIPLGDAG